MDLTIPLVLISILVALLGLRDLVRAGARDLPPYAMGFESLLLGCAAVLVLLPTGASVLTLFVPLAGFSFLWTRMDRIIETRVEGPRDRLIGSGEAGGLRLITLDRLDEIELLEREATRRLRGAVLTTIIGPGTLAAAVVLNPDLVSRSAVLFVLSLLLITLMAIWGSWWFAAAEVTRRKELPPPSHDEE